MPDSSYLPKVSKDPSLVFRAVFVERIILVTAALSSNFQSISSVYFFLSDSSGE